MRHRKASWINSSPCKSLQNATTTPIAAQALASEKCHLSMTITDNQPQNHVANHPHFLDGEWASSVSTSLKTYGTLRPIDESIHDQLFGHTPGYQSTYEPPAKRLGRGYKAERLPPRLRGLSEPPPSWTVYRSASLLGYIECTLPSTQCPSIISTSDAPRGHTLWPFSKKSVQFWGIAQSW